MNNYLQTHVYQRTSLSLPADLASFTTTPRRTVAADLVVYASRPRSLCHRTSPGLPANLVACRKRILPANLVGLSSQNTRKKAFLPASLRNLLTFLSATAPLLPANLVTKKFLFSRPAPCIFRHKHTVMINLALFSTYVTNG